MPTFSKLSAVQLGRLLAKDTLKVSNEESVLKAIFMWRHADKRRDTCLGLLFEKVRFHLMAASSLRAVEEHAQSIGPARIELQIAARKGIKTHQADPSEDVHQPLAKRRCLPHWWSDWGSSLQGGITIQENVLPIFLARNRDVFYVNDGKTVEQWCPGTVHCRKVLDEGEAINGIKMGLVAGIDCEKDGSLLVTDPVNNRIVRTRDGVSSVVG